MISDSQGDLIYGKVPKKLVYGILISSLAGILLSSIFPIVNHFTPDNPPQIPTYRSYAEALDELTRNLAKEASAHGCKGVIIPLSEVDGKDQSMPHLMDAINFSIGKYKRWRLTVDPGTWEEMKQRLEKILEEFPETYNGPELEDILNRMKEGMKADFRAKAEWHLLDNPEPDDIRLVLTINMEMETQVFSVEAVFTHPITEDKWLAEQKAYIKGRESLKLRAKIGWYGVYTFSALLACLGILMATLTGYHHLIWSRRAEKLEQQINERFNYMERGSFITAMRLIEDYLKYFPENYDILEFKDYLLAYTNNDPQKATDAYLLAKKLEAKLKLSQGNPESLLLTESERSVIEELLPYSVELQSIYSKIQSITKELEHRKQLSSQSESLVRLIGAGKIRQAEEELLKLPQTSPHANDLKERYTQGKQEIERGLGEIRLHLSKGEIANAKSALDALLRVYPEQDEAIRIKEDLNLAEGCRHLRLSTKGGERSIIIQNASEIMIGRPDNGSAFDIDISDKRISRPHAQITIQSNTVAIKDLGSRNGTYVSGKRINTAELKTNDLITLGKVVDFKASIQTEAGRIAGLALSGPDNDNLLIISKLSFNIQDNRVECPGDFTIYFSEDILVLTGAQNVTILRDGTQAQIHDTIYTVEAIK